MSTVAEIQQAISKLNAEERFTLLTQLFATAPQPDDPKLLAALDRGIADDDSDQVHSLEDVRKMIPNWISESRSPKAP